MKKAITNVTTWLNEFTDLLKALIVFGIVSGILYDDYFGVIGGIGDGGGGGAPMWVIEYGERLSSLVTFDFSVELGGMYAAAHRLPFSSLSSFDSIPVVVAAVAAAASVSTSSGSLALSERSP